MIYYLLYIIYVYDILYIILYYIILWYIISYYKIFFLLCIYGNIIFSKYGVALLYIYVKMIFPKLEGIPKRISPDWTWQRQ